METFQDIRRYKQGKYKMKELMLESYLLCMTLRKA